MAVPTKITQATSSYGPMTGQDGGGYAQLKPAIQALGWTLEYDDPTNFRCAFRNNLIEGTGDYLEIIDKAADHGGDAKFINVSSYKTMSALGAGTDKIGGTTAYIRKSGTTNSTGRNWVLYGDSVSLHLFTDFYSQNAYAWSHFGDIRSFKENDTGAFHLLAATDISGAGANTFVSGFPISWGLPSAQGISRLRYNLLGTPDVNAGCTPWVNPNGLVQGVVFSGSSGAFPDPASGGLRVQPVLVQDGDCRGYFRGLHHIYSDIASETPFSASVVRIESQATHLGLRDVDVIRVAGRLGAEGSAGTSLGALMIDIESDWSDF